MMLAKPCAGASEATPIFTASAQGCLGCRLFTLNSKPYLEGRGDLVSSLMMVTTGVLMWVIRVISLLTKSP